MAKFYDLHLLLQEDQRILFGDDSLGKDGPSNYPATSLGSEKPFIGYTTISGYNTTYPGMGISNIASTAELVISTPVAGERATKPYHLVRYDQLQDAIFEETTSDWQDSVLTFSGTPPTSPNDGDRYIVESPGTGLWTGLEDAIVEWNTASGIWNVYTPNEGFTTFVEDEDKYYVYYNGAWGPFGEGIDHGDLVGLDDDDHTQYILVDGSRGFTSTVSGVYPSSDSDLATKEYVDDQIDTLSSGIVLDHGSLTGLGDDDHTQYILVDGTRGFTATVSGVTPVNPYDLVTKEYVDSLTGPDDVVTLTGTQTITGDKTFDNTLTTFLGDVFFNGITITMSGTTLNTESGAVFNYDSTATINNSATNNFTSDASITTSGTDVNFGTGTTVNYEDGSTLTHEDGSSEVHEDGSTDTYESGSTETHESGSTTNYEDGSTINNSGDTIYDSTATITTSGTDINFGDGTTVNYEDGSVETHEDGSSEVYSSGSETTHESGSTDTYLPGSTLTFSGTSVEADDTTVFNYNDNSDINYNDNTTVNYGPNTTETHEGGSTTIFEDGSTVTFSGTTNFESDIDFGSTTTSGLTLNFNDNTISGTGDIHAGNIYADNIINVNQKWGRVSMIDGVRNQSVTFGTAWPDDDYTVVTSITNENAAKPSIYSATVGVKAGTGFTVHFSGKIDSSDYVLEWHAFYGEQN